MKEVRTMSIGRKGLTRWPEVEVAHTWDSLEHCRHYLIGKPWNQRISILYSLIRPSLLSINYPQELYCIYGEDREEEERLNFADLSFNGEMVLDKKKQIPNP
jgi:hypothetical protein